MSGLFTACEPGASMELGMKETMFIQQVSVCLHARQRIRSSYKAYDALRMTRTLNRMAASLAYVVTIHGGVDHSC